MKKVELPLLGQALSFTLPHFEGPLELLLYLIQKDEVDLFEIPLKELTKQFFHFEEKDEKNFDLSADFLWNSSRLLLLKSRLLLPASETEKEPDDSLRAEILSHLIEYAKLKNLASSLMLREELESIHYERKPLLLEKKMKSGLEEVKLEELVAILQDLIKKAPSPPALEKRETWEVAPKIAWLEELIKGETKISLQQILSPEKAVEELIVIFLAILELMKNQKAKIILEQSKMWITDVTYQPLSS